MSAKSNKAPYKGGELSRADRFLRKLKFRDVVIVVPLSKSFQRLQQPECDGNAVKSPLSFDLGSPFSGDEDRILRVYPLGASESFE